MLQIRGCIPQYCKNQRSYRWASTTSTTAQRSARRAARLTPRGPVTTRTSATPFVGKALGDVQVIQKLGDLKVDQDSPQKHARVNAFDTALDLREQITPSALYLNMLEKLILSLSEAIDTGIVVSSGSPYHLLIKKNMSSFPARTYIDGVRQALNYVEPKIEEEEEEEDVVDAEAEKTDTTEDDVGEQVEQTLSQNPVNDKSDEIASLDKLDKSDAGGVEVHETKTQDTSTTPDSWFDLKSVFGWKKRVSKVLETSPGDETLPATRSPISSHADSEPTPRQASPTHQIPVPEDTSSVVMERVSSVEGPALETSAVELANTSNPSKSSPVGQEERLSIVQWKPDSVFLDNFYKRHSFMTGSTGQGRRSKANKKYQRAVILLVESSARLFSDLHHVFESVTLYDYFSGALLYHWVSKRTFPKQFTVIENSDKICFEQKHFDEWSTNPENVLTKNENSKLNIVRKEINKLVGSETIVITTTGAAAFHTLRWEHYKVIDLAVLYKQDLPGPTYRNFVGENSSQRMIHLKFLFQKRFGKDKLVEVLKQKDSEASMTRALLHNFILDAHSHVASKVADIVQDIDLKPLLSVIPPTDRGSIQDVQSTPHDNHDTTLSTQQAQQGFATMTFSPPEIRRLQSKPLRIDNNQPDNLQEVINKLFQKPTTSISITPGSRREQLLNTEKNEKPAKSTLETSVIDDTPGSISDRYTTLKKQDIDSTSSEDDVVQKDKQHQDDYHIVNEILLPNDAKTAIAKQDVTHNQDLNRENKESVKEQQHEIAQTEEDDKYVDDIAKLWSNEFVEYRRVGPELGVFVKGQLVRQYANRHVLMMSGPPHEYRYLEEINQSLRDLGLHEYELGDNNIIDDDTKSRIDEMAKHWSSYNSNMVYQRQGRKIVLFVKGVQITELGYRAHEGHRNFPPHVRTSCTHHINVELVSRGFPDIYTLDKVDKERLARIAQEWTNSHQQLIYRPAQAGTAINLYLDGKLLRRYPTNSESDANKPPHKESDFVSDCNYYIFSSADCEEGHLSAKVDDDKNMKYTYKTGYSPTILGNVKNMIANWNQFHENISYKHIERNHIKMKIKRKHPVTLYFNPRIETSDSAPLHTRSWSKHVAEMKILTRKIDGFLSSAEALEYLKVLAAASSPSHRVKPWLESPRAVSFL